jgi:hypothetical protein
MVSVILGRGGAATMLLWCAAGACWVAQLFVPWTSRGTFSTSSMLDAVRLVRSGAIDAMVPAWVAFALLTVPAIGLVVGGSVGLTGAAAEGCRIALAVVASVLCALGFVELTGTDPQGLGAGGWLGLCGAGSALAAVVARQVGPTTSDARTAPAEAGASQRQETSP